MILALASVVALVVWAYLFLPPRRGMWLRTWVGAFVLTGVAVAVLAADDRLGAVTGPFTVAEAAIGLGVGAAWLLATQAGYRLLDAVLPGVAAQVEDLYRARDGDDARRLVLPIVAMGLAEELFFRGVIQDRAGLVAALVVYTAVQVVERKWMLVLAALVGGLVTGALFWWRGGLVAPALAHVLWTSVLTFVWPLSARVRPAIGGARRTAATPTAGG